MKAFLFLNRIDASDIFIISGCVLTGYGLFLVYNPGFFLAIIGIFLINIGILRAILGKSPGKG